jgi:hypothetical protein
MAAVDKAIVHTEGSVVARYTIGPTQNLCTQATQVLLGRCITREQYLEATCMPAMNMCVMHGVENVLEYGGARQECNAWVHAQLVRKTWSVGHVYSKLPASFS